VLVVTASEANPILVESVNEWMDLARQDDHTALMDSNLRRIYTPAYYRRNRWTIPLIGKLTKPKSYERFLTMAQACLDHNAHEGLLRIQSPTLVVGGGKDQSLGGEASREIARQIPGSRLVIFENQGHGLYEEEKTFNDLVLNFLHTTDKG
jgi:pimeloyl-ACP methyl ester carboxylesterase